MHCSKTKSPTVIPSILSAYRECSLAPRGLSNTYSRLRLERIHVADSIQVVPYELVTEKTEQNIRTAVYAHEIIACPSPALGAE